MAHVRTTVKAVALSFDDGPDPRYVDEVLGILEKYSAKATFFLVGQELARFPESGRKIVSAGHEIGNHSWSHQQLVLRSLAFVTREVEATDLLIRELGQTGTPLFRPPYGKKLAVLPYCLWKHGRTSTLWDVEPDSLLSASMGADAIFAGATAKVQAGSIILMHVLTEARVASRWALPRILQWLRSQDYRVVTVSDLMVLSESGHGN